MSEISLDNAVGELVTKYPELRAAMEAKKHINESVEAGREYVKAYIEFVQDRFHRN